MRAERPCAFLLFRFPEGSERTVTRLRAPHSFAPMASSIAVCWGPRCGMPLGTAVSPGAFVGCPGFARAFYDGERLLCTDCCTDRWPYCSKTDLLACHDASISCPLCDGSFLAQVARLLRRGNKDYNGWPDSVELSSFSPSLGGSRVDCGLLHALAENPVQAENFLAGLLFFNRALVVPVFKDADGPGGFRFLHDPVSGMVTAQFVHSITERPLA